MAFTSHTITKDEWTLIGDNVSDITFQNAGSWSVYINFNSSNSAPVETTGLVYSGGLGEVKKTTTDLTYKATPTYVFARAVSGNTTVVVETA